MKGFLAVTLSLVVLEVVLRPGVADTVSATGGMFGSFVQRLASPKVAGIPNRAARSAGTTAPPAAGTTPAVAPQINNPYRYA